MTNHRQSFNKNRDGMWTGNPITPAIDYPQDDIHRTSKREYDFKTSVSPHMPLQISYPSAIKSQTKANDIEEVMPKFTLNQQRFAVSSMPPRCLFRNIFWGLVSDQPGQPPRHTNEQRKRMLFLVRR